MKTLILILSSFSLLAQDPPEMMLAATAKAASGGGGSGISFVGVYGTNAVGTDPVTVNGVVVPSGAIILVFISTGGGTENITSVKFNTTETFTSITNKNDKSGGVAADNSAWILVTPTATTAGVTVDWSATPNGNESIHILVYNGVKNDGGAAGAYRARTVVGTGGGGIDVSVAATSGDWVVGACSNWDSASTVLAPSSHTNRRTDLAIIGSAYDFSTQDSNGPVSGTTVLTWANDDYCTSIGLALIPK